jgi:hypothetical protein
MLNPDLHATDRSRSGPANRGQNALATVIPSAAAAAAAPPASRAADEMEDEPEIPV